MPSVRPFRNHRLTTAQPPRNRQVTVLDRMDSESGCHYVCVDFKLGESPLQGPLGGEATKHVGLVYEDELLSSMAQVRSTRARAHTQRCPLSPPHPSLRTPLYPYSPSSVPRTQLTHGRERGAGRARGKGKGKGKGGRGRGRGVGCRGRDAKMSFDGF